MSARVDQPGLFDRPTKADAQRDRERLKQRLLPVVIALANTRGPEGFTASDVIAEGMVRGILLRDAVRLAPRLYSWVGPWLAGLAGDQVIAPKTVALVGGGSIQVSAAACRDASKCRSVKLWVAMEHAAA